MMFTIAQTTTASTQSALSGLADPMPQILFFGLAAILVVSALVVALAQNLVRAAVGLLFTLVSVSGLYLTLHAEFLAAVQLVVYAGGTLILIVFGVMLTNRLPSRKFDIGMRELAWALTAVVLIIAPLLGLVLSTQWNQSATGSTNIYTIETLGVQLLTPSGYLVPFEFISVVLVAVMIGAAYLARKTRKD